MEPLKVGNRNRQEKTEYRLDIHISEDITVSIFNSDFDELMQIKNEFLAFTPMEQRAYLNAVLFERLSK